MIHYHGTPIGGTRQGVAEFLMGRHALIPFPRMDDMAIAADVCQSFCLDNGAFTVWKQGIPLDVEGFKEWTHQWYKHPGFDFALIPDEIEGDEEANDVLIEDWEQTMPGVCGAPVWHMHESLDRLKRLSESYRIVALGSSGQWPTPGTDGWWQRMTEAMGFICDDLGRPPCKLHGLRMLNPEVFKYLPLSSADSTNAAVNGGSIARFGSYPAPSRWQRACVIADRIETHNSSHVWIRPEQKEFILTPMVPSADI